MKKLSCIILAVFLFSTVFFVGDLGNGGNGLKNLGSEQCGHGYRYNIQGWVYVYVEGEPYDRGYQHGYLLADEIVDTMLRWSNVIHNHPKLGSLAGDVSSSRYEKVSQRWWDFCKSKAVKMYWREYPEEYKEEIKGIADGVNDKGGRLFGKKITFEDILTVNEMYEVMTKFENPGKGIHPLRSFFDSLRDILGLSEGDVDSLVSSFLSQPKAHHCNGFIATGDATTNGQIVASQGLLCGNWWYSYYIAQRWNVILDIKPSDGYRVIMATSPGYIWSDENFYQNSNGIILIDTTTAQGLWSERGFSFAVRTRKAAQYSGSIDDAIDHMLYKNDGVWTAVLLFGDTKTGEIAQMDLGLYHSKTWRTKNGFYWSANNIMDPGVRNEANGPGVKGFILRLSNSLFHNTGFYPYYTRQYIPAPRDQKFQELGEKYYGEIDVDIVKDIMSTYPIFNPASVDCKITDSTLVENNGLWAFFGYQNGEEWNIPELKKTLKGVKDVVPATGWVLMYGLPSEHNYELNRYSYDDYDDGDIRWDFTTDKTNNIEYAYSVVAEGVVYSSTSSGIIYALEADNGRLIWEKNLSGKSAVAPLVYDDLIFIGSSNGLYALGKNGHIKWSKTIGAVSSSSVADDIVIVGTENGIHAFTCVDGSERWKNSAQAPVYLSVPWEDTVFVGSGNRCCAVDVENGDAKWVFEMEDPITSSPIVYNGTIYVGCWDTYMYALDGKDGTLKWRYKVGWGIDATPAVSDDTVFFGSMDNNFYALDKETGETQWVFTCQAGIHSSPTIYGEYVFFGSDDGRFYALNKTTGKPAWVFTPGYSLQGDVYNYVTTPVLSDPIVDNKTVFIGVKGHIFALDAQTVEQPKVVSEEFEIPLQMWILTVVILLILVITSFCLYFTRKMKK